MSLGWALGFHLDLDLGFDSALVKGSQWLLALGLDSVLMKGSQWLLALGLGSVLVKGSQWLVALGLDLVLGWGLCLVLASGLHLVELVIPEFPGFFWPPRPVSDAVLSRQCQFLVNYIFFDTA